MSARVVRRMSTFPDIDEGGNFDSYESTSDGEKTEPEAYGNSEMTGVCICLPGNTGQCDFLQPIRAQSPFIKKAKTEDVILPGKGLMSKRLLDLSCTIGKYKSELVTCEERPLPEEFEDNNVLIDVQLNEAQEELTNCVREWNRRIATAKLDAKHRMEDLLAEHTKELESFNRENGMERLNWTSPQFIELNFGLSGDGVYKAKINTLRRPCNDELSMKRKNMINRHKMDIVALNEESEASLQRLEERRQQDIAVRRAKVDYLASQLHEKEGVFFDQVEVAPKRSNQQFKLNGRIRLSLKNKADL